MKNDLFERQTGTSMNMNMNPFSDMSEKTKSFAKTTAILLGLSILTSYQIYLAIKDKSPNDHIIRYVFSIGVPTLILLCYVFYITFDAKNQQMFYMICFAGIVIFTVIYVFNVAVNHSGIGLPSSFTQNVYFGIILILGFVIIYNIFEKQIRNNNGGWGGFIVGMIFYIPCMVDILIKYIIQDYVNTPQYITTLFLVEILLMLAYNYIYPLYKNRVYENGLLLLNKPVFLSQVNDSLAIPLMESRAYKMDSPYYTIGKGIFPNTSHKSLDESPFRSKYAISLWVYVNPMPMSRIGYAQETEIFHYGTSEDYHPRLSLAPDATTGYKFAFCYSKRPDNADNTIHRLELPFQRWNNVVFNYTGNGVDTFINGELMLSHTFSENMMPKYSDLDAVSVGATNNIENENGLYGAICNVVYYKAPLMRMEIVRNYNMLVVNNPPLLT